MSISHILIDTGENEYSQIIRESTPQQTHIKTLVRSNKSGQVVCAFVLNHWKLNPKMDRKGYKAIIIG